MRVLNFETRITWKSSLKFEIRIANLGSYRRVVYRVRLKVNEGLHCLELKKNWWVSEVVGDI